MGLFSRLKGKKKEDEAEEAAAGTNALKYKYHYPPTDGHAGYAGPASYKPASTALFAAAAAKKAEEAAEALKAAKAEELTQAAEEQAAAAAAVAAAVAAQEQAASATAAAAARKRAAPAAAALAEAAAASAEEELAAGCDSHDASSVEAQQGEGWAMQGQAASAGEVMTPPGAASPASPASVGTPQVGMAPARERAASEVPPESSCGSCTPSEGGAHAAVLDRLRRTSPGSQASEGSAAVSRVEWPAAAHGGGASGQQLSAWRQIRRDMGADVETRLHELFVDYASFGASKQRLEELDSARFIKLCRECDLLCRRFTTAHADVAFTAAKKRKELRRLTFDEFCTALRLVAFRKQLPLERVVARVVGSLGPALNDTTTPDAVRLYDDLSTWTGVQFQVAAEAAFAATAAAPGGLAPAGSSGSLSSSVSATPGAARSGSLAELVHRQQEVQAEFADPEKAAAEVAAAGSRRRAAEFAIRQAEEEARAAVARAAAAEEAARAKALAAAAAAQTATEAVKQGEAAAVRAREQAAEMKVAAEVQQEVARQAERDAAAALRRAAAAEKVGQQEAEAALGVAHTKELLAKEKAADAWAAAAAATEAAEAAASAAEAHAAEGWSEDTASAVQAASEEAEAASMAAILAARQDAEAAMIDALMQAEAAEAQVEAARAEAAAAAEQLEAAKADAAALLAAAAAAEVAAESEASAKAAAQQRAEKAKEAATAAAVNRRTAAARAKVNAEKAAAAAAERREAAAEAAQRAQNAAVRAEAAVKSRQRAQQKLSEAIERARGSSLAAAAAAALAAPSTPENRRGPGGAAAASPEQSPAEAAAAALEAARARYGEEGDVPAADVKAVWLAFATFGKGAHGGADAAVPRMESSLFAKLCKECQLASGALTVAHVDLAFGKVADKGRPITFKQFMQALPLLAEVRGCEEREVRALIAAAPGPIRRGTMPLHVKFHDRWGK